MNNRTTQWVRACAMLLCLLGVPTAAVAQGGIIVFDDPEVIRGEIEKPEAYYILRPSNLDYEAVESEDSFLERLYETVEEPEF